MTTKEILDELKSLGNEKRKAHNIKNGATEDNQFGVNMGDIRKVAKKLKKADKNLATDLWNTNIIEAQLIATLVWKPKELSIDELSILVKSISFEWVADWFNSYIVNKHPDKDKIMEQWLNSDHKWAKRSAWSVLSKKIATDADGLDLDKILDQIENDMPTQPPEAQWTMNFALAHIGIHHPAHRDRAIAIGNTLGIYKDYPVSKGCTSPFAPIWIEEMVRRENV